MKILHDESDNHKFERMKREIPTLAAVIQIETKSMISLCCKGKFCLYIEMCCDIQSVI